VSKVRSCSCPDCNAYRIAIDCSRADFEDAVRALVKFWKIAHCSAQDWTRLDELITKIEDEDNYTEQELDQ